MISNKIKKEQEYIKQWYTVTGHVNNVLDKLLPEAQKVDLLIKRMLVTIRRLKDELCCTCERNPKTCMKCLYIHEAEQSIQKAQEYLNG